MEYRKFTDGSKVSLLGFGAMRFPQKSSNPADIDVPVATKMVDYAIEHGVNYFDTAWMYHSGKSEAFIGKALSRHPRDSFYLATKLPPWEISRQSDLERVFDEQLRRCGVDYFDYYLLHCLTPDTLPTFEKFGAYEFLHAQRKKGKLRHIGISSHADTGLLTSVVDKWQFDFAQIQLNYLDWKQLDAKGQYEALLARGIPIIVMEPVRGGVLATLCPESIKILREAAPQRSIASWAMRFAALPGVLSVLSGMSTPEQLRDNIDTYTDFAPLSPGEHQALERAVETYLAKATIPCTACRYCMPCPVGINIAESIGKYNLYKNTGDVGRFRIEYMQMGEGFQPDDCTGCGACLESCPQQLDIPGWLKKIAQTHAKLGG